jgi:predicted peptidase
MSHWVFFGLLLLILVGWSVWAQEPGTQTPQNLRKQVTREVTYDYLLYLPKDFDAQSKKRWPLVLFLHGAGERGKDVNKVKVHGPPKLVEAGQQFDFILVSPQCPSDTWWRVDDLEVLLDDIRAKYPVDQDRIYLTGLSMGGAATWEWLARRPTLFAAAVPICGPATRLRPSTRPSPIWAFHGDADPTVSVDDSRRMAEVFRKAGGDVKLTIYPGVEHDSWTRTYENPEMWTWFLSHRRSEPTTRPS